MMPSNELLRTPFVRRTHELSRLHSFLELAKQGKPQVCFIAGEAGAGKTALVGKFQAEAKKAYDNIIFATGECSAQVGSIDPYLPFKTITQSFINVLSDIKKNRESLRKFAQLTTQTIIELAPDLIGNFFPSGMLLAKGINVLIEKSGIGDKLLVDKSAKKFLEIKEGIGQHEICQQYTSFLQAISKDYILLLIIEDLHWGDQSSINLLFHLVRSLKEGKILIIGTYRPEDIKVSMDGSRHPFEPILNEIKRYRGDVSVDLNELSEETRIDFVNSLIDTEPNELNSEFRTNLFAITEGNALFATEMLYYLKERGFLKKGDEDKWIVQKPLNWDHLPTRVEAVIRERVDRLSEELKQTLTIASVEGENFTAQVVGRLQEINDRLVLERLSSQLVKRHHLVEETKPVELKGNDLSVFRFTHSLVHQYIYNDISESVRKLLHKSVAETLEILYGDNADIIAPQLARHFEEAHVEEKACYYLMISGDRALTISAFQEAKLFFERAIHLGSVKYPDILQRKLGISCYGLGQLENAKSAFAQSIVLANQLDSQASIAESNAWLGRIYVDLGNFELAKQAIETGLSTTNDSDAELFAHLLNELAYVNMSMEFLDVAENLYRRSLQICDKYSFLKMKCRVLYDLGCTLHIKGYIPESIEVLNDGLSLARSTKSQNIEVYCLNELGWVNFDMEEYQTALKLFDDGLAISRNLDNKWLISESLNGLGFCNCRMGNVDIAEKLLKQSLQVGYKINAMTETLLVFVGFAELLLKKEKYQEAYELVEIALNHPSSDYEIKHFAKKTLSAIQNIKNDFIALPVDNIDSEYHATAKKLLELERSNGNQ